MTSLIMTKGLPGSGKTTWAKAMVAGNPGDYKRVNKDDLRAMVDAGEWSKKNESEILAIRDLLIERWLGQGHTVVVDDTNLAPKHEARLQQLAKQCNAHFRIQDFTHVPIEECIRRDLERPVSVGEQVIRKFYNQFLRQNDPQSEPPEFVPGVPSAIIVDIDGTVAKMNGRSPYDYSRVSEDAPQWDIIRRVWDWRDCVGGTVIFCSGRPDSCRQETEAWLSKHVDAPFVLLMRPATITDPKSGKTVKNNTPDYKVKRELYNNHIKGKYNVEFVLDDRNQVVEEWRRLGLRCLQVADGNF